MYIAVYIAVLLLCSAGMLFVIFLAFASHLKDVGLSCGGCSSCWNKCNTGGCILGLSEDKYTNGGCNFYLKDSDL